MTEVVLLSIIIQIALRGTIVAKSCDLIVKHIESSDLYYWLVFK